MVTFKNFLYFWFLISDRSLFYAKIKLVLSMFTSTHSVKYDRVVQEGIL